MDQSTLQNKINPNSEKNIRKILDILQKIIKLFPTLI